MRSMNGLIACLLVTGVGQCYAQQSSVPKEKQAAELVGALQIISRVGTEVGWLPVYEVKPDAGRVETTNILVAKRMVFRQGASLVFGRTPLGKQSEALSGPSIVIVADEIVVEGEKPALISWSRELSGARIEPLPRGKPAPSGASGGVGGAGADGSPGEEGNRGFPGLTAPNLYLFARQITGPGLAIDMRGQNGTTGGLGQQGGDGGRGGPGAPAVGNILNCVSGAGHGGSGGRGGDGGKGGPGGDGGRGGNVFVMSEPGLAERLARSLRIEASGGEPGRGGDGGPGGKRGLGGEPGSAAPPFCREEPDRRGKDGADDGKTGGKGEPGKRGESGQIYFSDVPDEQLRRWSAPMAR